MFVRLSQLFFGLLLMQTAQAESETLAIIGVKRLGKLLVWADLPKQGSFLAKMSQWHENPADIQQHDATY